jgi:hypothetical protein
MKEDLIQYKTAVLAREVGFDWKTTKCYQLLDDGSIIKEEEGWDYEIITKINRQPTDWNNTTLHDSAPSQSLLAKWLREEHNWYFTDDINKTTLRHFGSIWNSETKNRVDIYSKDSFKKFKEAQLYEALKLLKK